MKGNLYLFVAPSGAGKTALINELFTDEQKLVSVTTRPKRNGELEGKSYYFITEEQYEQLEDSDELIQKAYYVGNHYGVTRSELESKLNVGDVAIAVVIDSYFTYKNLFPNNAIGIFLNVSKEEIHSRLLERNDGEDEIRKRLAQYDVDSLNKKYFTEGRNYIVNVDNATIKENAEKVRKIIEVNKGKAN